METKICTKCKVEKSLDCFRIDKNYTKKDGSVTFYRASNCNNCKTNFLKKYRKTDKYKATAYVYRNSEKGKKSSLKYKMSEKRKEYLIKYQNSENFKKTLANYYRKNVINTTDVYLIQKLKRKGFTTDQIKQNTELIEVQRLIIKTKRLWKTSQS